MSRPLVDVQNLSKAYGKQTVLEDVSFQITEGSKIALIGRNGAGKSTLLKALIGEIEADQGSVNFFDWTRVGVVRQNEVLPSGVTTQSYLEAESGKPSWDVKKLGKRFGLQETHMELAPAELSGGYQMRVKLTALFLQEPNLLFLDEPVNYLDLQTLLLLEGVLQDYKGSFVLVAHDRTFLEHTCTSVMEIERGQLTTYTGGVSDFLAWKREQVAFAKRTNKKLAREMKHHQKFVDRFRYKASLASRAQNKIKHIARLRGKITKIEDALATTRITIRAPHVHPGPALRVRGLMIGYGDYRVADNISFEIARGDKVVIAGENGRGKSTLLKTLVGKIYALDGDVKWWKHADIGYYDQLTSEALRDRDTVLDHLTNNAPVGASGEQILMMAGNFLFRGDDLDKRVSVLSGGERARLALAGVLLKEHTVLVLDEPTNHMDVETSEALAVALQQYTGTVIFVSHARTFVSTLADRILEVRNGTVREYTNTYDAYVEDMAELMEATSEIEEEVVVADDADRAQRRERHERRRELQRSLKRIEKQIEPLEAEKSAIMKFFFENPTDYAPPKAQRLTEVKEELEKLERNWLHASEQLAALDA